MYGVHVRGSFSKLSAPVRACRHNAVMRLWQLNVVVILCIVAVFVGARLLAPAPTKQWDAFCVKPADALERSLCAEFR